MFLKRAKITIICLFVVLTTCFSVILAEDPKQKIMIKDENVEMKLSPSSTADTLTINNTKKYFLKYNIYSIDSEIKETIDEQEVVTWYKVIYCEQDVQYNVYISVNNVYVLDMEFENQLVRDFPESYQQQLRLLHISYPTWNFVAYKTNIEWSTMISKHNSKGKSLINGTNIALRSTAEGCFNPVTQKFIALDGSSWYQANQPTIEYYIDPRNFLNQINVFMFLDISYKGNEEIEQIQNILNGSFMENTDPVENVQYSQIFYDAGQSARVSPIYLAVLALQEQGKQGSSAITGNSFSYNGKTYSSLYNFYNIGATSGADNWKKGLIYANGGENGTSKTYSRPWNTPIKAIRGGASWIANGYISKGQDTMYYKKFNCTTYQTYNHEYMTNIRAPYSQSITLFNAYKNTNTLDTDLTFEIPIYNNMPLSTALPTVIDLPKVPNDEPEPTTGDLIVDLAIRNEEGYLSGFQLGTTYEDLKNRVAIFDKKIKIKITRNDVELQPLDVIGTGCIITFTDTYGTSQYTIIIQGDLNGDGDIDTRDYLIYRKTLLGVYTMSNIQIRAAKVNGLDEISTKGYLAFTKYLLGVQDIED